MLRAIWWEITKETTAHTNKDLGLTWAWAHPMIPVLLFAIYAVLVWFVIGEQEAAMQIQERLLLLAAPLCIYPPWWFVRLLRTIPEREQRSGDRIALLHRHLKPQLTFEFLNEGRPAEFAYGNAVQMVSGDLCVEIRGHERVICGVIGNASAKEGYSVTAHLVELVGDNGNRLRDPIQFNWSAVNGSSSAVEVPPRSQCTLEMFRLGKEQFHFARSDLPLEYLHFFFGGSVFIGRISLQSLHHAEMAVHFQIDLSGDEPRLTVVQCVPSLGDPPEYIEGILIGAAKDNERRYAQQI